MAKFQLPVLHSSYDDHMPRSNASGLDCSGDPGFTKQSFAEECDINVIVRRFGINGPFPNVVRPPTFGDFSEVGDFQSAMALVVAARESFMSQPASVRAEFDNDPGRFVEFCSDDRNFDRMAELGLVSQEAFMRVQAERKAAAAADVQAKAEELLSARSRALQAGPGELGSQA